MKKDAANEYIEKMTEAQGIVLASPVYFIDVTPEMKALIDRAGFVGLANGRMYRNKVGAALACFRRSGGAHTVDTMNHFFLSNDIIIAGRATSVAKEKGEVEKDAEGNEPPRCKQPGYLRNQALSPSPCPLPQGARGIWPPRSKLRGGLQIDLRHCHPRR